MGFFDGNVENGFDAMFDWNHDGNLDVLERASQFAFGKGLMDSNERREAMEDAGLDPDDYDF